jgi:hypothetical protein
MVQISYDHWSFDSDLQIIQADVILSVGNDILIDEPLCIDVGLPALLLSVMQDTEPDRFAQADEWERMPFFVCGCGDPECRAYSFTVKHLQDGQVELTHVEERQNGPHRELEGFVIAAKEYKDQVKPLGEKFLSFIDGLDYRPYMSETVPVVRELLARMNAEKV